MKKLILIIALLTGVESFGQNCIGCSKQYSVPYDSTVVSYVWTKPPGWIGGSNTRSIFLKIGSQAGWLTCYAVNANGCVSEANKRYIKPTPMITPTIIITYGKNYSFNAWTFNEGINPQFLWVKNGNVVDSSNSKSYTDLTWNQGDIVGCTMLVTNTNGKCIKEGQFYSNQLTEY